MRLSRLALLTAILGCNPPPAATVPDAAIAVVAETHPDEAPPPRAPLGEREMVRIPAGTVLAGSAPGTTGRRATYEADLVPVEIGAFEIDRLPYPNDPSLPIQLGARRDEAAALCSVEGKRLCTELEWERACKADTALDHPSLFSVDPETCNRDPLACASPFDVLSMGTFAMEWTASDVTRGLGNAEHRAVLRGGALIEPPSEHRCASRHALAPLTSSEDVTFRCCRGEGSTVAYPGEHDHPRFATREADRDALRRTFASIPWLRTYAASFEPSTDVDVDRALGRGGRTRADVQLYFADGVLAWSPIRGEEAWVVSGSIAGGALIAVLHPMPDGSFVAGARFEVRGEGESVAIGYDGTSPTTLYWASCWGCPGENGTITLREDGRIVITQN